MEFLTTGGVQRLIAQIYNGNVTDSCIVQIIDVRISSTPRGTAIAVRVSDGDTHHLVVVDPSLNRYLDSGTNIIITSNYSY
jgi:hypothetical protein